ncbi:hypothetical protein [Polaromonas sp. YR568]|uniref:hypothetical protein n=1 Tax=Polaromonas sp. YR568 TaxID=1855301 RepID=UPI00398C002D
MKLSAYAVYAVLLLGANLALAQVGTPAEGEYVISDGAWGTLEVQVRGKFMIETVGANAHICGVEGVIVDGKSKIGKSACQLSFKAEGQDVRVATNGSDACRDFCGMRAWFEGLYRKPSPLCVRKSIDDAKKKFKKSYVAKDYAAALAVINPVATQCKPFLNWVESAWVLNDLALTQFKLGDRAACIKTLQGLAPDAAKSDDEIKGSYPPADSDAYLPVVQATRTNLRLCTKP